jgi:hypothetical protein
LNDVSISEVESLLVGLLLDGDLEGHIDRVSGILYKEKEGRILDTSPATSGTDDNANALIQKCQAMNELLELMNAMHSKTLTRLKEDNGGSAVRGFVH